MKRSRLRSSPLVAAFFSWLHGTRFLIRGSGHTIRRHNAILRGTKIEIYGKNCRFTIGPGARLWDCSIPLVGDESELSIGADCRLRRARLSSEDPGSRLLIGEQTSMTGATLVSQEGRLLQVGKDCMIAQNAELRNSDSHAIYDATSGVRINPPGDVILGHHVWIGLGASIFKGARIGDGSIIGARAIVTGAIPPDCIAYGGPASPRRTGIRWARDRPAHFRR